MLAQAAVVNTTKMANPSETRSTLLFLAAFSLYVLLALALDAKGDLYLQRTLGALTWLFLALTLRCAPAHERLSVLTMVAVATIFECFGSLVFKFYEYNLANLPFYVPPGHGLFYLMAQRSAALQVLRRKAALVVLAVLLTSGAWALRGAFLAPVPDVLGLLSWLLLVAFLARGRDPLFFAVSFIATMALEYYGTFSGTWRWAEYAPILGVTAGNPPSAVGAAYCVIDATTRLLLPAVARTVGRVNVTAGRKALHASGKLG